ncbi:MAG TPA: hypothetical protein VIL99_03020 [Ignavibacteria bacterium]
MDYKTEIELFETLDSNNKAKEIYAHFGQAVFCAQVLEQQSINMIAVFRQSKDNLRSPKEINELWDTYDLGKRTFGKLIKEVSVLYNLSDEDSIELNNVLKLRNYITHDYFRFNNELFYSDSGQKRMIKDFIEFCERAKVLDEKLTNYTKIYADRLGLTDELIRKTMEQTRREWEKRIVTDEHNTIIR